MKVFFSIVGGITFFMLIVVGLSIYIDSQKSTDKLKAESELREEVLGTMTSADDKIKEAQKLLSKNEPTKEDQVKAKQLIDTAVTDAERAAKEQPDNPRTWFYLSSVYKKLIEVNPKAIDLSIEALTKALELSPEQPNLLAERATMYIHKERYDLAERDLQKAKELNPNTGNIYYKLGNVYKETKRFDKAREAYAIAKQLTSKDNKMAIAQIDTQLQSLDKLATASSPLPTR